MYYVVYRYLKWIIFVILLCKYFPYDFTVQVISYTQQIYTHRAENIFIYFNITAYTYNTHTFVLN